MTGSPKRSERQAELQRINDWLEAHPKWEWPIALLLALIVLNLAELLRLGLDRLAR